MQTSIQKTIMEERTAAVARHDVLVQKLEEQASKTDELVHWKPTTVPIIKESLAVMAPSTTPTTASRRVLSSGVPTDEFSGEPYSTVDDRSPGARRLYDLIVGGSASPTPAASPRAPSSASSTGGIPESAAVTAMAETDLHFVTHSTCSTKFLGDDKTMSPISAAAVSASTSAQIPACVLSDEVPDEVQQQPWPPPEFTCPAVTSGSSPSSPSPATSATNDMFSTELASDIDDGEHGRLDNNSVNTVPALPGGVHLTEPWTPPKKLYHQVFSSHGPRGATLLPFWSHKCCK